MSIETCPPLDASEIDQIDANASAVEKAGMYVPFLGWMVSQALWRARTSPIHKKLMQQLLDRQDTHEAWGEDSAFRQFAQKVCEIAKQEFGWPNARFVPWDPSRAVFWAYRDGLDFDCFVTEVEIYFKISFTDEEAENMLDGNLQVVIENLFHRVKVK